MAYQIKLEMFEGPFDLLIHLINKAEVDIYDIPIASITDQYLEYIATLQALDLEVASEFLVMAATLIQIKSRMLLPKPPKPDNEEEPEVDPRDELVARLLEYKRIKQAAMLLKEREKFQGLAFSRPVDAEEYLELFAEKNPLKGLSMSDLLASLQEALNRIEEEEAVEHIPREEVSLRERMREISRRLILANNGVSFKELFKGPRTRTAVVVTFLALLELIRLGKAVVHQPENFSDIYVFKYQAEPSQLEVDDNSAVS